MESSHELGFGIMRMPQQNGAIDWIKSKKIIDEYMKADYCYFDTHPSYMMNQSQRIIKELVVKRYDRARFYLANKMPYFGIESYKDYKIIFEQELIDCGVNYFDYYLLHAVSQDIFEMHRKLGGFHFLSELKRTGKVKKIGISFHDKSELLEKILKKYLELDFVQLQINYIDWKSPIIQSKECYEIARKYKKEIIVMEPLKGGSLARGEDPKDDARKALQFIKCLSGIHVILSGMSEVWHIKENRSTLDSNKEKKQIDFSVYQKLENKIKKQSIIPCTECRYCIRECPKKIKIPDIISLINTFYRPGIHDKTIYGRIQMLYRNIVFDSGAASECINCGMCEQRCPQKISIRKNLKKAVAMFEKKYFYTSERNAQILIYLMKEYRIKKIIVSPGAMNASFVYSLQQDDFFEMYSAPDERSAAYMACGLSEESGEIVALSCTGATASRNYISGLTEAYYRNIPILAITSAQPNARIGHNIPQMINRTRIQKDIVKMSVELPIVKDDEDEWNCVINGNKALNELWHRGTGPVHINLITTFSQDFSIKKLPYTPVIRRIKSTDNYPDIPVCKMAIFCGTHSKWNQKLTLSVEHFCEKYGSVVICDHTSNYIGKYRVTPFSLEKRTREDTLKNIDLLIHIGNISGAYFQIKAKSVWRVHPNGEYCDTFRSLSYVFEMDEMDFFEKYNSIYEGDKRGLNNWKDREKSMRIESIEVPFSNAWIASQTASKLPENAVLHLGILNSLRIWNFYYIEKNIRVYSNTGGFGIDGCLSTMIGASLSNPEKLYFAVLGDLAFFYDMNSLGNRHIGNNICILVINNGCGTEFKNYNHAAKIFGNQTDLFIAAKGHYGNKSKKLLKNYVEALGFIYKSASSKEEYIDILPEVVNDKKRKKSLVVEIFTDSEAESEAYRLLNETESEVRDYKEKKLDIPEWVKDIPEKEIVLWGCGHNFIKNISKVEQQCKIRYVCDNNRDKWGKEVLPGINCISPQELKKLKNIFVVIMIEDAKIGFDIVHQLQILNINQFDIINNWLEYSKNITWRTEFE